MQRSIIEQIQTMASVPQTSVSIKEMVKFGYSPKPKVMYGGSLFLLNQLPIRLAHRVVELEKLPHDLSQMPSIQVVKGWYTQSCAELLAFQNQVNAADLSIASNYYNEDPVGKLSDAQIMEFNLKFVACLDKIKRRHDPTTTTVAKGVIELKRHWKTINSPFDTTAVLLPTSIQSFLDRFYMSRIGIRMLLGQHISLVTASQNSRSSSESHVGIICTETNLQEIIQDAIDNSRFICSQHFGVEGPEINIIGDPDLKFMYVPSHLHHCIFELLKNSLRAVVERFGPDCEEFPPINVVVAEGREDITIKISDEGGGIARSGMPLIWTYMYTTGENPLLEDEDKRDDFLAPLAGYGYGLPLSRLYSRYFGGDLRLISMEGLPFLILGYGTDAYLHLSRLSDSDEPLP